MPKKITYRGGLKLAVACAVLTVFSIILTSSSHREAPLISNDPLADNTDLYAFRSPENPEKLVIIANYIPGQLPQGGPNYYSFGENIRYEIHIDNTIETPGDDFIYRFTFFKENEDPTTFFNIRLGKQNLKTTYKLERFRYSDKSWETIIRNGVVPPPNIGPRSISSPVGLNAPNYNSLIDGAIKTATTGERAFCGTSDDPFFVDLGGIFDLGDAPRTTGSKSRDGLKCLNVSTIALEIDIPVIQRHQDKPGDAKNILDHNYVIGVWASASRKKIRVLNKNGTESHQGPWVQVSRLGMPLTNEAVIPIGKKDLWNSMTPYEDLANIQTFGQYFYQPELALYMDDTFFGSAVPALAPLRIQRNSLGAFGFGNDQQGLFPLKGSDALDGTALADYNFGDLLLKKNSPRSIDLWPIFHTGVPNLIPYQLATGKGGNPLAPGKPFINNILENGGDMLRLNLAVPVTPRDDPKFSSLGLVQAAVLGLTDPAYNGNANLEFIPNMDGFPNGRRLEDDVTLIELQAVSGIVLAAVGLWYDDFDGMNPLSQDLLDVLTYRTGVNANDVSFKNKFPFVQQPFAGTDNCDCDATTSPKGTNPPTSMRMPVTSSLGVSAPSVFASTFPNPAANTNTVKYRLESASQIRIVVMDQQGRQIKELVNKKQDAGVYTVDWNTQKLAAGTYFISIMKNGKQGQAIQLIKN
ncbi:MAG: DUF4331 family protein [Chitinophagaceae bacterium]